MSENMGKLQGFNNKVSRYTFYGNTDAEPEAFMGTAPRFNTLSTSKAASAENVFSAGGSGSTNTSIWFMSWGENTAHMIYPEGMVAGFQHQDLGNDLVSDANGGQFWLTVMSSNGISACQSVTGVRSRASATSMSPR